ncbi:MAG: hypothetical protein ACTSVL_09685, partial [Promethearchaeota archaeon]
SGYGFIGNPFSQNILQILENMFSSEIGNYLIIISNSTDLIQNITNEPSEYVEFLKSKWPADLIAEMKMKSKLELEQSGMFKELEILESNLWKSFINSKIRLIIPKHPLIQQFLKNLQENGKNPILIGYYADFSPGEPCIDLDQFINSFDQESLGITLGLGKLQRGKKILPATQIAWNLEENIPIIQKEGLILEKDLLNSQDLKEDDENGEELLNWDED